jgi:general secretion pathway protein D
LKSVYRSIIAALLLAGCATQEIRHAQDEPGFREASRLMAQGRIEEGMKRMEQVLAEHPGNVEYRNYHARQRELHMTQLLGDADTHRRLRAWDEAEQGYRRVLALFPQNQRAMDGLRQLATARKHQDVLAVALSALEKGDLDDAQSRTRSVLAEDAAHPEARALYERIEQQRAAKSMAPPKLRATFRTPITLEFRDVALKSVFEFIGRAAGINFTYDQELRQEQKISIFVRDTSIEEALDAILSTNQLGKKILNDNTLLIYPMSRSGEYQELFVRSFYLGNTDAKRMMALLKTILKTRDLYIDERLNTLVMRDTPEAIRMAEKLIASQDLPDPEVMLEVEVMEISRKTLEDIGIKYPTQVSLGVQGNAAVDGGGNVTLTPGQLSLAELKDFHSGLGVFKITDPVLAFNLLHQDTDTDLLANPQIRVKNREKARIHIGDKIPVITSTANSTGFVSESVTYLETGIKLNVEPTILLNDEVSIKVELEVSNQTDRVVTSSGTLTYTLGSRNANTVLRLHNGETQVLAGLFRDDRQDIKSRVPGLADLPLVGRLFTDKNSDRTKKEIVLLITPRILSNILPPDATYTVFPSGVEGARAVPAGRAGRNVEPSAVPMSSPVAPATQEPSAARAQAERSFADSVLQQ